MRIMSVYDEYLRNVKGEWKTFYGSQKTNILKLAELLENEGYITNEIARKIRDDLAGYAARGWIYEVLPDKYKRRTKPRGKIPDPESSAIATKGEVLQSPRGRHPINDELAGKAFELFRNAVEPADVVIRLQVSPETILSLWEMYKELTGHSILQCKQCWQKGHETAILWYGTIRYPCSECKKYMTWNLSKPDDRNKIIKMLEKGGITNFYHVSCSQKRKLQPSNTFKMSDINPIK
jgi:hypothetical protein